MNLMMTLGVITSAWFVWFDAARNNIGRQDRKAKWLELNYSPGMLACSTLLMWVVAFPLYLRQRKTLIELGSHSPRAKKGWFATFCALVLSLGLLIMNGLPTLYQHYGPGFDRKIETNTVEGFQQSFAELSTLMSAEQVAALQWAFGDLSLEQLNERYPNATARRIVAGEANIQLKAINTELEKLAQQKAKVDQARAEIAKLKAEVSHVQIDEGFMGPAFKLEANLVNGSRYAFSRIKWKAKLYLNDSSQPSAETEIFTDFSSQNGLQPAQTTTVTARVDDRPWLTIEVKTAKKLRVELVAIADSAVDLGDRPFWSSQVEQRWQEWTQQKQYVERMIALTAQPPEACLFNCGNAQNQH